MKQPGDVLWKCPRCETVNNGSGRCRICGFSVYDQSGNGAFSHTKSQNQPDHNKRLRIAIVVSLIVLAVTVIAGLSYYFFSGYYD